MTLDQIVADATDRALARCAPDDPPRVVALRVAWAVRVALRGEGHTARSSRTRPRRGVSA